MSKNIIVGIDFGTTNTVVASNIHNELIEVVRDLAGRSIYPSVVAYKGEKIYTGYAAKLMPKTYAIRSVKRLLGRSWNDEICKNFNHPIESGPKGNMYIDVKGKWITPENVIKDFLHAVKKRTESILHTPIYHVVITVPARFDDRSRNIIRNAAKSAHLKVLRIINEPTAAAIGYGIDNSVSGIYGVYDLGGGTFDFSLLSIGKNTYHVLATGGSLDIGGDDIDIIVQNMVKNINKEEAKEIKESLSKLEQVEHKNKIITRVALEKKCNSIILKTVKIMKQVIDEAAISYESVSGVILVGGSTKMPLIKTVIKKNFVNATIYDKHNPEEIVAIGAAQHAKSIMHDRQHTLLDVLPLPIGIETMGGGVDVILQKQTPLPASASRTYTTAQSGQTSIHFNVVQGERNMAKNCISLGVFQFDNITPMPKNMARIKVDFQVDIDGTLNIYTCEEGKTKQHIKMSTKSTQKQSSIDDTNEWIFQQEKLHLRNLEDEMNNLFVVRADIDKKIVENTKKLFHKASSVTGIHDLFVLKSIRLEIDNICAEIIKKY